MYIGIPRNSKNITKTPIQVLNKMPQKSWINLKEDKKGETEKPSRRDQQQTHGKVVDLNVTHEYLEDRNGLR